MFVINRHGEKEAFNFNKTKEKILSIKDKYKLDRINVDMIVKEVISSIVDEMLTSEIDELTSIICYSYGTHEPEYQKLAFGIKYNNLLKLTSYDNPKQFYMKKIKDFVRPEIYERIDKFPFDIIDYENDWTLEYLSLDKLIDTYLLKSTDNVIWERPQHLLVRLACELYDNLDDQIHCYKMMAKKAIIHSSPTLFNSGTRTPQMASCFLLNIEDSVEEISNIKSECLKISARAGGLGIAISDIRSAGSTIKSINGKAVGIMKILESINKDLELFPQGGKRPSSCAIYLEPHHPEILSFIEAKSEKSNSKAKELFYGLWLSDEFINSVYKDKDWKLTNNVDNNLYGEEFSKSYKNSQDVSTIKAKQLWMNILTEQCGSRDSMYICFKDTANKLSNIKNIGPIRSSNLCCEIMEPANKTQTAVCNLASISLPSCVENNKFNFALLKDAVKLCVRNINQTIDKNMYINLKTELSNKSYRPMGIGIQGLHDCFVDMNLSFDSEEARHMSHKISEAMYYYAIEESCNLAKQFGKHQYFEGTELSKGVFHHDLYVKYYSIKYPLEQDWEKLRKDVLQYGVRNALFIALMPTASSSHLLNNSPSFEPYTSLIYKRRIKGKEYIIVIDRLYKELIKNNLWDYRTSRYIEKTGMLPDWIPSDIHDKFKTAYELDWNVNLDHAIIRSPFVDQSQSLNHFIRGDKITPKILNRLYKKAFKNGLKTASYYIHKNTIDNEVCLSCVL